jgi:O-antigen/teichoic acid export membrane protein
LVRSRPALGGRREPLRAVTRAQGEPPLSAAAAADIDVVAKGGATQIVGQVTQRSLSFFFTFVAARILGPAAYGLYRQVSQILAISGQLGLAGFNYASMRFISLARATGDPGGVRGAARVGLSATTTLSLIVCGVLVLAAEPLASLFVESESDIAELANLLRIGAAYVPFFALMQVLRYCTQAYKTMVPSVLVGNIIQPLVRFVLGVVLLLAGFGVAGAVTSLTVSIIVAAAVGAWYFNRMLTREERLTPSHSQPAAMVRFALPQGGSSLLGVQNLGLGIIILGIVSSNRAVGLFAIALALQGPGTVFLGGIVNIWAPVVSELHALGEIERLDSLYKTINRWIATFSFPVFAALMLEPDLFAWIGGGVKGLDAAPAVAILAAGNIFYTGTGPTGYVISMTGHPGVNFVNSVVAVALYAGLGFWIVPDHGIVGMAIVDSVVTALVNIARVVEAKILVGVQPFGRSFLKPIAATIVGAAVLLLWRLVPGEGRLIEIVGVVVAAIAYLAALAVMGIGPEERHVLDRIKKRVFPRRIAR